MKWYIKVISNYANFKGRARRKEYWMFVLFNAIFTYSFQFADYFLNLTTTLGGDNKPIGLLNTIYSLFVLIPSLAMMVRRLHDTNKSGRLLLIFFLPPLLFSLLLFTGILPTMIIFIIAGIVIIESIILLAFLATNGDKGNNKYGSDPKIEERSSDLLDN
jgi:uncharacterized membrane protein YhaH (DUF805 family)